jgi:diacylglycerol kinase family enzyme
VTYHLLVNDNAGSAEQERIDETVVAFRAVDVPHVVHETSTPYPVDDVLDQVGDDDVLVVAGGDGSLHLAVDRARAADRLGAIAFAVVPLGTGNDLARALGVPTDPADAVRAVLAGAPRPLDLIADGDGAVCVNSLHAGIGVEAAERAQGMKRQLGDAAYAVGAVVAGLAAEGHDVRVEVDGSPLRPGPEDEPILLVAVLNGPTFGGGTPVAPDARLDDGLLDVVVTTATGPAARAAFGASLRSGTHLRRDDVVTRQGREVRITGARIGYNVDGELDPEGSSDRTFRVLPGAWRVVAPRTDGG